MREPIIPQPPNVGKRPFLSARFVPLALLLFIITLLSLILPGFFQRVIYVPIASRLVVLFNIYRGIPQNIMWAVMVFITVWIMLVALRPAPSRDDAPLEEEKGSSRLIKLIQLAADARKGQHARWELAREMQQVALQVMQAETGETAVSLRQRIAHGDIVNAPPEIAALLRLCADLPNYRSFIEARDAAPNKRIPQLDALDLDAAAAALVQWHKSNQEQH